MSPRIHAVTIAVVASTLSVAAMAGADTRITLKQLPAAVRQAAHQNLQGGTIKGASKEIENGQTLYEVETVKAGHARDLLFDADGHLVAVEEVVPLDAVPPAVRAALTAQGKVLKVESVTKGAAVSYEGVVDRAGKRAELAVDANGKPITP
jgi:uncharacterized membrane protein YkoI